jgi:hypothetical protein
MSVIEDFEIPAILKNIYKNMDISPVGVLKNYALTVIYGKINKYEIESKHFEKKYGYTFQEFKKKIEAMEEEENSEWDDDLLDWQFACENLLYWRKKLEEIKP